MTGDHVSNIRKYPELASQLTQVTGIIIDEAMMADRRAMAVFMQVLCESPLAPHLRRVELREAVPHIGFRDIILGGDIRQLPPASGEAPFWSTLFFQNLFKVFVL